MRSFHPCREGGRATRAVRALFALACLVPGARAHAFGGLWASAEARVEQTGAQLIFVDHPDATVTALIRVQFTEEPGRFAWVIPVPGTPTIGVSSSVVFRRLDVATMPEYWVEYAFGPTCSEAAREDFAPDSTQADGGEPSDDPASPSAAVVLDRGSVGPYDYTTLGVEPNGGDPGRVASDWLAEHGYAATDADAEVLRSYLERGLNLLAFKLERGAAESGEIQPLVLTYEAERPEIPLRPAAASARADLGLQVWVFGPAQAIPANYRALVLNDAKLDWLSAQRFSHGTLPAGGVGPFGPAIRKPGNYDDIVTLAADEAGGHGFVTELAGPASQFRDKVWSLLDEQQFMTVAMGTYEDGIDAVLAASAQYAGWDGFREALAESITLPEGVTLDELARDPEPHRGGARVDTAKFLQRLEEKVVKPVSDVAALLLRAPYLTRLFTTISPAEMTVDPSFDYNPELAQINNVHIARQQLECDPSLTAAESPWRIELPQGGVLTGEGASWPIEPGGLPANLKVVELDVRGSGAVITDNSDQIAEALFEASGSRELARVLSHPPHSGLLIGGTQTLIKPGEVRLPALGGGSKAGAKLDGGGCSVSRAGSSAGAAGGAWLGLALLGLGLLGRRARRRRVAASCNAQGTRAFDGFGSTTGMWRRWASVVAALAGLVSGACSDDPAATGGPNREPLDLTRVLTLEQLRDPETCKDCHPTHYREWSSSMHAYAAKDPVFLAMNRRGQRETNGELGNFCVRCHAPMAVYDGKTDDGLNIEELPDFERGVSCYFCHNVVGVDADHNGLLRIANDTTMRGAIRDPLQPAAHRAEYSEYFEDTDAKSSALCGGCHDIMMPNGVHLERTFQEYRAGLFSKSATGEPPAFDSCVSCHMPGQKAYAAVAPEGVVMREVHEHLWPGIDVPLIDFPGRAAMRSAVEDCQLGVASVSFFTLEVTPPDLFTFQVETNAGHNQPSGSAQDRRMWLEFLAYDSNGDLIEEVSSGNIADDELEEWPEGDPKHDPNLLMLRDRIFDADGEPVHMFWEAAKSEAYPTGFESSTLPVKATTYIEGKRAIVKQYRARQANGELPARVTARLKIRPIGLDVLHDLVESGDLAKEIADEMPTFTFGAQLEWTPADGLMKPLSATTETDCSTYRCLLEPESDKCK